jgi:hypothetical protein
MPQGLFALIIGGAAFGVLAGIAAAIILYAEWRAHKLAGRRARNVALVGGIVAWLVFTTMMIAWAYVAKDLVR